MQWEGAATVLEFPGPGSPRFNLNLIFFFFYRVQLEDENSIEEDEQPFKPNPKTYF